MSAPSGYTALDFVGFTDKGTYSPIVNYMRNDLVHHGGNIMRCLIDNTKNVTPVVGANWTVFVSDRSNLVEASIAPIETSPATAAHAQGSQLFYNDTLYKAKTAIAIGDSLVVDTNIEAAPNVTTQLEAKANTADLGTAAAKDSTNAVTSGSTDLVESGAVYTEFQTLTNQVKDMNNVLGAKNLLLNTATTQTIDGITFTVNDDKSITCQGTASANINFIIGFRYNLEVGVDYRLSGCPSGGSSSTYNLAIANPFWAYDTGNGLEFTCVSTTTYSIRINIASGTDFTTAVTFYPMIRLASITDNTYEPYAKTNKELTDDIDTVSSQISDLETDIETEIYNNITSSDIITYGSEISSVVYVYVAKQGKRVSIAFTINVGSADIAAWASIFTINSVYRPKINYAGILHGVSSGEYINAICFVSTSGSVTSNTILKANCGYRFVFDYITA